MGAVHEHALSGYLPIVSSVGLVAADAQSVIAALRQRPNQGVEPTGMVFPAALSRLEPLTAPEVARRLVVECGGGWTALFDNFRTGSMPASILPFVGTRLGVRCLVATSIPHFKGGPPGAVQLFVYDGSLGPILQPVRVVEVVFETRWDFGQLGAALPFERLDAYQLPRKRDRLTHDMLVEYCAALGTHPFDASWYGRSWLFREGKPHVPTVVSVSLAEARAWLGFR